MSNLLLFFSLHIRKLEKNNLALSSFSQMFFLFIISKSFFDISKENMLKKHPFSLALRAKKNECFFLWGRILLIIELKGELFQPFNRFFWVF